jgi:hypothetical protein
MATRTTIIAAAGSVFDMGASLTLTIYARCGSRLRRERWEFDAAHRQVEFSYCKRHRRAEPIIADDLAPVGAVLA